MFRSVNKTVFYETHQKDSKRKLPRDPTEGNAHMTEGRTTQRSQAAVNLGNSMDVSLGSFSQAEQQCYCH